MSGATDDLPGSCAEILEHPLRQTLFILLRHRAATAPELQEVVKQPLKNVRYHLGVMVRQECLTVETAAGTTTYRADPRTASSMASHHSVEGRRLVLAMSLLDAAWTSVGKSPEGVSLVLHWEVFHLDDEGLIEASGVATDAMGQIERVAHKSRERQAGDSTDGPMHAFVAVASLADPAAGDGRSGDDAG